MHDELVKEVYVIDTSGFVSKTQCNTDKSDLENKITNTSGLVKKTDRDAKVSLRLKIEYLTLLA